MTRALLALAHALLELARAIRSAGRERMCCSEHALVVERKGSFWFRRHTWNADQWAPIEPPGAANRRTETPGETGASARRRRVLPPKPRS